MENKEKGVYPLGKEFAESIATPTRRDRKILFWMLSILIVPIFAQIYILMLTFFISLLVGLFTRGTAEDLGAFTILIAVISIGCAIGTYAKLWKAYKKNYLST